jgi:Ca2+-binding RTX toxin-like protein
MSTITGTAHDDLLIGTSNADSIDGKDGNDILKGRAGDDILLGGNGNDHVYGGTGDDHLFGGDGNDVLSGRSGTNFLDGGAGDDTVLFTDGIDHILGGVETLSFRKAAGPVSVDSTGDIYLNGEWHGDGADLVARVNGSPFNDQFIGFNEFHGGGGNDSIQGEDPEGKVFGDSGNDHLGVGQNGGGFLFGGSGNDTLAAGGGTQMTGGSGSDTFSIDYTFHELEAFSSQGAVITDFHHNEDHLQLVGNDPTAFLTNEGDLWTVHSNDPTAGPDFQVTFEIAGVTSLSPDEFSFV